MLKALVIINTRLIYSLASKMLVFQTRFANALRNIKLIETNEKDYYSTTLILPGNQNVSGCAKLIVSLRATAKQSQSVAIASLHFVPLAMTNAQLILPKYLVGASRSLVYASEQDACPISSGHAPLTDYANPAILRKTNP